MVLSDVQDDADFRRIADKRSVALVGFRDKPFAISGNSVPEHSAFFERDKPRPGKQRRRKIRLVQNMPDHPGHRALATRSADANRLDAFRNFSEHLAPMHPGNPQFQGAFQVRIRLFDCRAYDDCRKAWTNARTVLRKCPNACRFELCPDTVAVRARKLSVRTGNGKAFARQVHGNCAHAGTRNADKKERLVLR